MTKVIVSHDVDHLFRNDHYADLTYPKLWVRESLNLLKGRMTVTEWTSRMRSPFHRNRNHIQEVMQLDQSYGVKSTFFFGMAKGLGMSYRPETAAPMIKQVEEAGFCVGVHGINYQDKDAMQEEFDRFTEVVGHPPKGIRMHYVRYDDTTFEKLAECGYLYDSTEFIKSEGTSGRPHYHVKEMIEFPLTVMDAYLPYQKEEALHKSAELIDKAGKNGVEYIVILFHDCDFDKGWKQRKLWYEELIKQISDDPQYQFISFEEAVEEIKRNGK